MKLLTSVTPCVLFIWMAGSAAAVPILSVDADPGTPGIQSVLSIPFGNPFTVDVVIIGVETGQPLNAFQFDLVFDPLRLAATGVVSGGFLPAETIVLLDDITPPDVMYAEASLGGGAVGHGVLASISFDTLSVGTSDLDLMNVILAALIPPGGEIPAQVSGGRVTVTSGQAIPEPSTLLLLGMGVGGLLAAGRRR